MTAVQGKTFLPGLDLRVKDMCEYATKYGGTIVAVTAILSPADAVAMAAGIASVQEFCLLVDKIHRAYDPNFGDTVAD